MEDMRHYNIADCHVRMNCRTPFMLRQCAPYAAQADASPNHPWIDLGLSQNQREEGRQRGDCRGAVTRRAGARADARRVGDQVAG